MHTRISVTIDTAKANGRRLLAPTGMTTPYQMPDGFSATGGTVEFIFEANTGQAAALIAPTGDNVILQYQASNRAGAYPEAMFKHRPNRFTRAANELVNDARKIADSAVDGHAAIQAIARDTAERFTYGHPEKRYYEGFDEIPHLGCGTTAGSCVDINAYLIAALRSAGFEAGYVYGYFFPKEKGGHANDGHCWVVTRHAGVTLEWDIAHHLKLGTRDICCGLNPKPGHRVALAHSMGHSFPALAIHDMKLLGEAIWVDGEGGCEPADISIFSKSDDATEATSSKAA
ncbi:MAG: transglutaminase-like domain-containing protein [Pseudomonadota bacterium]